MLFQQPYAPPGPARSSRSATALICRSLMECFLLAVRGRWTAAEAELLFLTTTSSLALWVLALSLLLFLFSSSVGANGSSSPGTLEPGCDGNESDSSPSSEDVLTSEGPDGESRDKISECFAT